MEHIEWKLIDLVEELQTWVTFSPDELKKAKSSKITDKNNRDFRNFIDGWSSGVYDDDPDYAGQELKRLI